MDECIFGICFDQPSQATGGIFGFPEFISALALLAVVYTVTDTRYRFRIAVAPAPIFSITFAMIGIIGFLTLLTDVWVSARWPVPESLITEPIWRGTLGGFFLLLAMVWIYYGFIRPPIFGKRNFKKYSGHLYHLILKGSDTELPILAHELARSAKSLVNLSKQDSPHRGAATSDDDANKKTIPSAADYAYETLLLIANRKFCRHVVHSSPGTVIELFEAVRTSERYQVPLGQFAKNIATEAIANGDSILYHEDEGYSSGLIGYLKPFSIAVFGNYRFVEELGFRFGSPLDIDYVVVRSWNSAQLKAYTRAVLITFRNYLDTGGWHQHSYVIYRAFENVEHACSDLYKLNETTGEFYSSEIFKKLGVAVEFTQSILEMLNEHKESIPVVLRTREREHHTSPYDMVVDLLFKLIRNAATVQTPQDTCWAIQHNALWGNVFDLTEDGKATRIVAFKLRRKLYDEVKALGTLPHYGHARILGYCLNVMGLKLRNKKEYGRDWYALQKVVLSWTEENYLELYKKLPAVAMAGMMGGISFDKNKRRLVRTYAPALSGKPSFDYLKLRGPKIK